MNNNEARLAKLALRRKLVFKHNIIATLLALLWTAVVAIISFWTNYKSDELMKLNDLDGIAQHPSVQDKIAHHLANWHILYFGILLGIFIIVDVLWRYFDLREVDDEPGFRELIREYYEEKHDKA
jgi:flagellar biosynthesis protein FlhB